MSSDAVPSLRQRVQAARSSGAASAPDPHVASSRRGALAGLARRPDRGPGALINVYLVKNGQRIEKETKTGEERRVSLDPLTCELFACHFDYCRAAAAAVGAEVSADAFVSRCTPQR